MLMWESRKSSEEPPSQTQDVDTVHESLVTLKFVDSVAHLPGRVDQSPLVVRDVVRSPDDIQWPEGIVP